MTRKCQSCHKKHSDSTFFCADCVAERQRLAAIRRYLDADECEADQIHKAQRVAEYAKRVQAGQGVFEKPVA